MGLGRFEINMSTSPTLHLLGVRSNQLSYRPIKGLSILFYISIKQSVWALIITCANVPKYKGCASLRKEVIQPQVPLGLPCYDFTPVMNHTVVIAIP